MRKPNLGDLKFDKEETRRIKSAVKASSSIKITVNIDSEILLKLKELSSRSNIPYQRLLNIILDKGLKETDLENTRLDRLEAEIRDIKKKLAA